MSLSLVQGSVMAAEMAIAADGAHHGPSDCDGCGGGDHEGMDDHPDGRRDAYDRPACGFDGRRCGVAHSSTSTATAATCIIDRMDNPKTGSELAVDDMTFPGNITT
jgi:hypothetical protein